MFSSSAVQSGRYGTYCRADRVDAAAAAAGARGGENLRPSPQASSFPSTYDLIFFTVALRSLLGGGDKLLKIWLVRPQNGTAALPLKGQYY